MKLSIKIISLSFLLSSCSINHFVLIKSDGSARVETDYDENLRQKVEMSEIITDIDTSNYRLTYTIDHLDSIGQYLSVQNPGFLSFKSYKDSISVTSGNVKPYDTKPKTCCHLSVRIRTEEPMEAFKANGEKIRRKKGKNKQGIWLSQTIRQQVNDKKNIDVILKKKH